MLSDAALNVDVSVLDFVCVQDKVNGTVREKARTQAQVHTHTHHPDLTRLVNHLSQGQGTGQTPLSSVCPPSLPFYLSLHLLLYFFASPSKGTCPFSTDINLVYISLHGLSLVPLSLLSPSPTAFLTLPSSL